MVKINFYTFSIQNLEKVLAKYECPFDQEGISDLPGQMKIMWDCLSIAEQQKFSQKKQMIEEILPAWHEINSLFYFTKINNKSFKLGKNDTGSDLVSDSTKEYIECKLVENPINSNYVRGFPKISPENTLAKSEFIDTDKLALTFTNSLSIKKKQLSQWKESKKILENYNIYLSFNTWPLTFNGLSFKDHIEELDKILRNIGNPVYRLYFDSATGKDIGQFVDLKPLRTSITKTTTEVPISEFKFENLPFEGIYLSARCPFNIPNKLDFYLFKRGFDFEIDLK